LKPVLTKSELLNHAGTAVERTARSLADMRGRLHGPSAASLGRQHRLLIDGALLDLGRRHEMLTSLYHAMIAAPDEDVPACWQKFFACYDDYLETARDVRSRLIQDEGDTTHQPAIPPGQRRNGGTQ
jgi:hypothetical protein